MYHEASAIIRAEFSPLAFLHTACRDSYEDRVQRSFSAVVAVATDCKIQLKSSEEEKHEGQNTS